MEDNVQVLENRVTLEQAHKATNWRPLFTMGGIAALLQLAVILAYFPAAGLGPKPTTAQGYFQAFQSGWLAGLLRGDILSLLLVALYLGTLPCLYIALQKVSPSFAVLASSAILVGVTSAIASDSGFSLMYLSGQYMAATDPARQAQLLAAGEAVIAADMWHSTGSFLTGILLQGGGVIFSIIMLRSKNFSKVTAISGLVANGLDLTQHLFHLAIPGISATILYVAGPFYLVWFPMLAWDFFRLRTFIYKK